MRILRPAIVEGDARPLSCLLLALLAVLGVARAAWAQPDSGESTPGWHHVVAHEANRSESKVAMFPARYEGGQVVEILDPAQYRVHITSAESPGVESVFPAGSPFRPPTGRYLVWLQGPWTMSPFSALASFRQLPSDDVRNSIHMLPARPAGRVTVDDAPWVRPDHELRLLFDTSSSGLRHELTRRREVGGLGDGLLMPEGTVVAGLWDPREERYVALSRPFEVLPRSSVTAPLERPDRRSAHVVAYIERPAGSRPTDLAGLALTMAVGDEQRPPELAILTSWGVYGVWYGLPPGTAVLSGGNVHLALASTTVELPPGQIVRLQGTLSKSELFEVSAR